MILRPEVRIIRNYRPDFLRNPMTGSNLEIDFYFPETAIGIEIQGNHHIEDDAQQKRDELKRNLCEQSKVMLVEICLSQIGPRKLYKKLYDLSSATGRKLRLRKFNINEFLPFERIVKAYTDGLKRSFPESPVNLNVLIQRKLMGSRFYETTIQERLARRLARKEMKRD
jgi:hypothetical protein